MKYLIVLVIGVVLGAGLGQYVLPPHITAGKCVDSITDSIQNSVSDAFNRVTGK